MPRSIFICILFSLLAGIIHAQEGPLEYKPDLRIDSISYLERPGLLPFLNKGKSLLPFLPLKPRKLYLQYTITNIGRGPAYLYGEEASKLDNVAVRGYFSGDKNLNKGDFLAGGSYVPNGSAEDGILAPNESYVGFLAISLRDKSRYIGVLILKVDDLSCMEEEDETNNTFYDVLGNR